MGQRNTFRRANSLGTLIIACGCLAGTRTALASPPALRQTTPVSGATAVDPNLRFIQVEFDQDMAEGSHSWVGGGDTFPTLRGMPYWTGPRTAVLPVSLVPDHDYALAVNSSSFTNFRGRDGTPATPTPLTFRTGPARPAPDPTVVARTENAASIPVLRRHLDRYYAHRDVHKVDWETAFRKADASLKDANSPTVFAEAAGKLLAAAEDLHVTLAVEGRLFASHSRRVPYNCNPQTLRQLVPAWQKLGPRVVSGRFSDDIGYLLIASWDREHADTLDQAQLALDALLDTKGLIVDVRMNAGGDEGWAQQFAGRFITAELPYAQAAYRAVDEPGGFTQPIPRVLRPDGEHQRYAGQVVVLMGHYNMSSTESFLLMLRQVPGCKLIGETSFGSSGNPQPHGLPNGVIVNLPCWKDMDLDGHLIEGVGVRPDVEIKAAPADFAKGDPVLEAALKLLRGGTTQP